MTAGPPRRDARRGRWPSAPACRQTSIALGGRSMGGRMCSMAVAEGLPALGLVLISYPLHPPGKPDQLRTEHFPRLSVPCLFVSGTRDAFGIARRAAGGDASHPRARSIHHFLEGGDHGLRRRRRGSGRSGQRTLWKNSCARSTTESGHADGCWAGLAAASMRVSPAPEAAPSPSRSVNQTSLGDGVIGPGCLRFSVELPELWRKQ